MKIAIIGAGPAGIYTALLLRNFFGEIHLYEKNSEIGEKLKLTGGGRMNLFNQDFSVDKFYSSQKNILQKIFKSPFSRDILSFFDDIETEYFSEGKRIILKSQNAKKEVQRLFEMLKNQENVKVFLDFEVKNIYKKNDKFEINNFDYDFVVISSGGMVDLQNNIDQSNVYAIAKKIGHQIVSPAPALCSIIFELKFLQKIAGTSFLGELSSCESKQKVKGDIMITHQGISGPAVLDFSLLLDSSNFYINFLPEIDELAFIDQLTQKRNGKNSLRKFLWKYLPKRLADWHLDKINFSFSSNIADLKKEQQKTLIKNIFRFEIQNAKKANFKSSWTTKGGVDLREVQTNSLESKICQNLFFTGEILDVTGFCGGYNIGFAMLSAKMVSESLAQKAKNH